MACLRLSKTASIDTTPRECGRSSSPASRTSRCASSASRVTRCSSRKASGFTESELVAWASRPRLLMHGRDAHATVMQLPSRYIVLAILLIVSNLRADSISVVTDPHASPRVEYGANQLIDALKSASINTGKIVITKGGTCDPEGFSIDSQPDGSIVINGRDDSGELYGCMELAARVREAKSLPAKIHF